MAYNNNCGKRSQTKQPGDFHPINKTRTKPLAPLPKEQQRKLLKRLFVDGRRN
jgi:hypothetical protein